MASRLPLASQRLVLVTGKGGVGKTAVTAALAHALTAAGRRVLAVELGPGRLATLLGTTPLPGAPTKIAPRLWGAGVEPEAALAEFVESVLRLRVLARRLLASTSFQVLAAAAPGLPEYLVLRKLAGWLDAHRLGRPLYDVVLVDAPASGHSLPLLQAPWALGTLARLGPIADGLGRIEARLVDPATTLVCLVATPEELAVRETIELYRELTALGIPVAPPIVNAFPRQRFTADDEAILARLAERIGDHPWLHSAHFEMARRETAAGQVTALRRALGMAPVRLPFLPGGPEDAAGLARLSRTLAGAAGLAA